MKGKIMWALFACLCVGAGSARAQKIDSIFVRLYTDSLKLGTHNYINVDGKRSDGRYIPLDTRHLAFESNAGKWTGNSLFLDSSYRADSVVVHTWLKDRPETRQTIVIYIKKHEPLERLKTEQELLDEWRNNPPKKKKKNS